MNNKTRQTLSSCFLITAAIFSAACGSSGDATNTPAGLVVVNADRTGTVKRVLVKEDTEVAENAVLFEIAVPSNVPAANVNTAPMPATGPVVNPNQARDNAERELQVAAVELQRIEPLVASNSAPQAQLDAARAQYQRAQERLDQIRRSARNPPPNPAMQPGFNAPVQAPPAETIVPVRATAAGNVRVISVSPGQPVKAGDPVATIQTKR